MANKARNKGIRYEQKIRLEMIELGYKDCQTTRYSNKQLDDQKVDLNNTDPFHFQLKAVESAINYHKLLAQMPNKNLDVVIHRRGNKSKKNVNEVVSMSKETFYIIIQKLNQL